MIARIRKGNDFHVAWQIKRGGVAENLENVTDIKLERTIYGITTEHTLFTVSGDTITAEIPAEVQTHYGQYKLTLSYELVDTGMSDDDRKCKVAVYAFAIVDPLGPADDLLTVDVASDVSIGFKGDKGLSAYQVWLENGNVGTEDDYFDYLRQPATDAAASISTLEQTVSDNEALRVTAEQGRSDAELLRVGAESERNDAEGLRDSAEDDRIEAEGIRDANETARINAESDRVDAEDLRDQAEVAREEAEGLRQTNTTTAIQNAGLATTAANTATGNANDAATAANTAAGLANTARTELTTAVNTKLGEADGKIEEMNTTLSTYDGRVSQVESDIDQLAGELNQTDAKIKDIENILSTSNPSQSAQISVSGVSPLALPKNASNGGMSIKLEGLTDAGVNFIPTGRVRSVGKNLFNPKLVTAKRSLDNRDVVDIIGYLGSLDTALYNNGIYYSNSGVKKLIGLTFKASTQYTIGFDARYIAGGASNFFIRFYYSDGTNNYVLGTTSVWGNRTMTSTAGKSVVAILLEGGGGAHQIAIDINTIDVENSVSISGFTPYRETSLYLTAPELRSNGTVKDEIRKGVNGYELVKRISDVDGTVLATPVISPISYGGILNSAENGTVYHEPVIADAGVYGTNMAILLTDYPIASIEEIIKHEGGVDTYLNASTAVIAGDKLSFTHPDLASGDLVLFTYAFDKESTNGNITATFYDSNVVKIDTVTGKAYKITDVVTNGVLTRTLTEV